MSSDSEQIRALGAQTERLRAALAEQPPPVWAEGDVWSEIIARTQHPGVRALYRERRQQGIARYGTPLQRGNGRDFLSDALQEVCDLIVYLEGAGRSDLAKKAESDLLYPIYAAILHRDG